MSIPAAEALQDFDISPEEAAEIERLTAVDVTGRKADDIMKRLDEILDGHGIEGIEVEGAYVDSYYQNMIASYVNMGDAYIATIVHASDTGEFLLTTWGDFLEAWWEEEQSGDDAESDDTEPDDDEDDEAATDEEIH